MLNARSADFETFSPLSLPDVGADVYAECPDTGVYCLAYEREDLSVGVWSPGEPDPTDFLDFLARGGVLRGWNVGFERAEWEHVVGRICPHWPKLRPEQYECTMARAYAQALPGGLDNCAKAIGLEYEKDKAGYALMRRMCAPLKSWRDNPVGPPVYYGGHAELHRLREYCRQDVVVERELAKRLAPLSKREREVWLLDQRINKRGVALDVQSIKAAQAICTAEAAKLDEDLQQITEFTVPAATNPNAIRKWLNSRGVATDNLQAKTVEELLKSAAVQDGTPEKRALEIRQEGGKASIKKLPAMLACANADGRARGLFGYHGAAPGRWIGFRAQPHNLPRPRDDLEQPQINEIIEMLREDCAAEIIRLNYGPPIDALSSCLRSMFAPAPGKRFIGGDFSNIESRVIAWMAGEKWKLKAFREYDAGTGPDIYKLEYAKSFGVSPDSVTKYQRQKIGKPQGLGLGYQGGPAAFLKFVSKDDIPAIAEATQTAAGEEWPQFWHDLATHPLTPALYSRLSALLTFDEWAALKYLVTKWRKENSEIVAFWYELERCALDAVSSPGHIAITSTNAVKFTFAKQILYAQLPSGRCLTYPYAQIVEQVDEITEKKKPVVQYMSWDGMKKKWCEDTTYGGRLAENCSQAVARDILADAMLRAENRNYPVVLHVHDEIVTEVPEDFGSPEELREIMCASEPWATGLPVSAKTEISHRYGK